MVERICNLFLFVEQGIIVGIGVRCHEVEGDDDTKLEYLKSHALDDLRDCERWSPFLSWAAPRA